MCMKNKKTSYLKIIFILVLGFGFLFLGNNFRDLDVSAQEGDAIAIRVLPNPDHYNPMRWYKKQGFSGNPEPMKVDGYEAVRDGRTVYVNVANVSGTCILTGGACEQDSDCTSAHDPCLFLNSSLYTNMYLISYNQNAGDDTLGIFDKILENWRFNANLTDIGRCFSDAEDVNCLTDDDCPSGNFCSSLKARITRDIKRLADVIEIEEAVEKYKDIHGNYPKLTAGTYLSGKTISTWPSWQTTFSSEIGMNAPVDPINKLGDCGGNQYDEITCWDDQNKSFAGSVPDSLPSGSRALVYVLDGNGFSYELCGVMESGLLVNGLSSAACVGSFTVNSAPQIECGSLTGIAGESFEGYINASDSDGDNIIITISGLPSGFDSSANIGEPNKRKIISANAPVSANNATFNVSASDGVSTTNIDCTIAIHGESFIVYPIEDMRVIAGKEENLVIYANHSKKEYDGMRFDFTGNTPAGFTCETNSLKVNNDGRFECAIDFSSNYVGDYDVTVQAFNNTSASTQQNFKIEIYNEPPVMGAINCSNRMRMDDSSYECIFSATDPEGHNIGGFSASDMPTGMSMQIISGTNQGRIFKTSASIDVEVGVFNISIEPRDQFGAIGDPVLYTLQVDNYCGNDVKDSPNTEGVGGPRDDGYEDCDGSDGLPDTEESVASWQYGCSDNCSSLNEGWCGDSIAQDGLYDQFPSGSQTIGNMIFEHSQTDYGEECDFGRDINCCNNCSWTSGDTIPYIVDQFVLANGENILIDLPPSRGIQGGSFTTELYVNQGSSGGTAIVFITDLSQNGYATVADYKAALYEAIESLSNEANDNNANVHIGAIGHGNCSGGPICHPHEIINVRNLTNAGEGDLNRADLESTIGTYGTYSDLSGGNSGVPEAIAYAHNMLANYTVADADKKSIIILTDGIVDGSNNKSGTKNNPNEDIALANASAAKNDGISIYSITYSNNPVCPVPMPSRPPIFNSHSVLCISNDNMCKWSSDNGVNCHTDHFSYVRETNSNETAQIAAIYNTIGEQILADKPNNITYTAHNSSGNIGTNQTNFTLPNINCDISGANGCDPSTIDFSSTFTGNGRVGFDVILNIIPLCEG